MIRRLMGAVFAAVVLTAVATSFGTAPVKAAARTTITPWRGEQTQYRTIEGSGFAPYAPITLWVTDPAHSPWWQISADGLMTEADGTLWFQVLPSGFVVGNLQDGVWQLKVCAPTECQVLTMFIGGDPPAIPAGLPAQLCTPRIVPYAGFQTFGPPGTAVDPWSGYTYNDIVAYCGPYATPWVSAGTFLVPINWQPGTVLPFTWPYQTAFPWPAYWYGNVLYNNMQALCIYQMVC